MHENILHDYILRLPRTLNVLADILADAWSDLEFMYSYIITVGEEVVVRYIIAETKEYNTISVVLAIAKIKCSVNNFEDGVLCFDQAPIDLYIKLHEPMIEKMANRILRQWPKLEFEDLCQICRLCCVELNDKGYYLHKRLLWTTFKNKVIEEIRPLKKRGTLVSIYDKSYDNSEDKDLTIMDTLVDTESMYKEQDDTDREAEHLIFEEVKEIIIDLIGQRQFDTLYRDYKNQHTTTTSRKLLIKVKNHLNQLGLSKSDFNKKYH